MQRKPSTNVSSRRQVVLILQAERDRQQGLRVAPPIQSPKLSEQVCHGLRAHLQARCASGSAKLGGERGHVARRRVLAVSGKHQVVATSGDEGA
eukprot:1826436-Pyramimonas_sp.AAC.1